MKQSINPGLENNSEPVTVELQDKLSMWKNIWETHFDIPLDLLNIRDAYY